MPRRFPSPPNETDSSQDAPRGPRKLREASGGPKKLQKAPGNPSNPQKLQEAQEAPGCLRSGPARGSRMTFKWASSWTLKRRSLWGTQFRYQSPRYARNLSKQEREARSIRGFTYAWIDVPPSATVSGHACGKAQRLRVRAKARLRTMRTMSASQRMKPREGARNAEPAQDHRVHACTSECIC